MIETLKDLYVLARQHLPSDFEAGEIFRFVVKKSLLDISPGEACTAKQEEKLRGLLLRRAEGYPLQYLMGEWEFYGVPLKVGPGVLSPRQDTETLVDAALKILKAEAGGAPEVLDLCSGSGCVALAVEKIFPAAKITALEFSPEAYGYLKSNIELNSSLILPVLKDLRGYSHHAPLDLIISNPPYIPRQDFAALQKEVGYEPLAALDGGHDGLHYFRAIARRYRAQLRPGGVILLEVGKGQDAAVLEILRSFGFADEKSHKDLNGIVRVVEARASA
jgi:release factor glutamine methyltransferase